jgi:predicted TIM-barrel fold metal-dependent hydrolase
MYRADGPEEMKPVGEVEFVQGLAAASASGLYGPTKVATGIVGHADLKLGTRVEPVLEALLSASPNRLRGIRHLMNWDAYPGLPNREERGVMTTADFADGAKVVAGMGLSMDTFMYFPQLPDLVDFAAKVPELTIILDHSGGLVGVGPYAESHDEAVEEWKKSLAEVARFPNVYLKLGGLGELRMGYDWHEREKPIGSVELSQHMKPIFEYCIEQFTPERCMFESNFPVDKWSYSYHVLYNAYKRMSKEYTESERSALFHDTAARVYRIEI